MQTFLRFLLLATLGASAFAAQAKRDVGEIGVEVKNAAIRVRVTSSAPELQGLAQKAFNAHGRYTVVGSGQHYDLKFTPAGGTQVKVDITRGSAATPVHTETVSGTTLNDALLRAADVAVVKTNGIPGQRGFFSAKLAFISKRTGKTEVYTSNLFLGEAVQVTRFGALALSPRWAPDGSKLIYTSYFKKGAPDIYVVDPATGRHDEVASYKGTSSGARFSPSGAQIAMILSASGTSELFVTNARGTITPDSRKTRSEAVKASPCWSPDGRQIVLTMEPGPQLYVIGAGGGAPRRLSGAFSYMAEPDWSRTEPNKIVCTVRKDGRYQIAVVDAASGAAKVVSQSPIDVVEPSWLADGRHVVCTVRDRRTSVLHILDTESGKLTPISGLNDNMMQASALLR